MKKIKTDFLIVGSGLYGCVLAERISSVLKKKVIILEKKSICELSELCKKGSIDSLPLVVTINCFTSKLESSLINLRTPSLTLI